MTAKNRQLGLGAFVLALLAPPLNLWAQEAQTASEDEDAMNISCGIVRGNVVCEEILVTATRRTANVQDVAVAVTAVTGEDLRALGINDLFRLDAITPGLQVGLSGADPRPAMRGARTQQVEANDVAISFYTDGIYPPPACPGLGRLRGRGPGGGAARPAGHALRGATPSAAWCMSSATARTPRKRTTACR